MAILINQRKFVMTGSVVHRLRSVSNHYFLALLLFLLICPSHTQAEQGWAFQISFFDLPSPKFQNTPPQSLIASFSLDDNQPDYSVFYSFCGILNQMILTKSTDKRIMHRVAFDQSKRSNRSFVVDSAIFVLDSASVLSAAHSNLECRLSNHAGEYRADVNVFLQHLASESANHHPYRVFPDQPPAIGQLLMLAAVNGGICVRRPHETICRPLKVEFIPSTCAFDSSLSIMALADSITSKPYLTSCF